MKRWKSCPTFFYCRKKGKFDCVSLSEVLRTSDTQGSNCLSARKHMPQNYVAATSCMWLIELKLNELAFKIQFSYYIGHTTVGTCGSWLWYSIVLHWYRCRTCSISQKLDDLVGIRNSLLPLGGLSVKLSCTTYQSCELIEIL